MFARSVRVMLASTHFGQQHLALVDARHVRLELTQRQPEQVDAVRHRRGFLGQDECREQHDQQDVSQHSTSSPKGRHRATHPWINALLLITRQTRPFRRSLGRAQEYFAGHGNPQQEAPQTDRAHGEERNQEAVQFAAAQRPGA